MSKKVTAEFKQGLTLGFDIDGVGTFQWRCGACDFPYFDFNKMKTQLLCESCGAVNAKLQMSVASDMSGVGWNIPGAGK